MKWLFHKKYYAIGSRHYRKKMNIWKDLLEISAYALSSYVKAQDKKAQIKELVHNLKTDYIEQGEHFDREELEDALCDEFYFRQLDRTIAAYEFRLAVDDFLDELEKEIGSG